MKRLISILLSCLLVLALSAPAFASGYVQTQSRAVLGADLSEEQIALVYQAFGVARGSVA